MHMCEQTTRLVEPKAVPKKAKRKGKNPHSSPQFEFITSVGQLGSASKDAESKQIVRVHAMRSFLRQREASSIDDRSKKNVSLITIPQAPSAGKFKLDSWSRKSNKKKSKEQMTGEEQLIYRNSHKHAVVVQADMGPFEILNIPLTPQVRRLLHHYHHDFTQNSFAVNPEGSFFDFAVNDEGLLHSILSLVALHYDLSQNNRQDSVPSGPIYDQALYHQSEAVRIVNRKLNNPREHPTDALMATVALLANYETMNGTIETSTIHVEGLKKMVNLRGGFHTLVQNQVLQRVVAWTDFSYSSTWNKRPVFSRIPHLSGSLTTHIKLERTPFQPLQQGIRTLSVTQPEVLEVMHSLNLISKAISMSCSLTNDCRLNISNAVYSVEHRILSVREDLSSSSDEYQDFDLSRTLLLAGHLYLHLGIRELPRTAKMHRSTLHLLAICFKRCEVDAFAFESRDISLPILLWVLFIGAVASWGLRSHGLFLERLRDVVSVLGIVEKEDFEGWLRSVFWTDRFYEKHCSGIWDEVTGVTYL